MCICYIFIEIYVDTKLLFFMVGLGLLAASWGHHRGGLFEPVATGLLQGEELQGESLVAGQILGQLQPPQQGPQLRHAQLWPAREALQLLALSARRNENRVNGTHVAIQYERWEMKAEGILIHFCDQLWFTFVTSCDQPEMLWKKYITVWKVQN